MASIPLVALNARVPEQPDLLQKFGQLQALRNMQQQSQIQAAEAPLRQQALQQGVDQQQRALSNQQALTQAYQQWDGKNYDDLSHLALKAGATGDTVQAIQQHGLTVKEKYSQIAKDDAATGASNIATLMKKNDVISGALSTVLQTPDDQLPQALLTTAQQLKQQGLLDDQHMQMAQQIAASGNPAQMRSQLGIMRKGMLSDSQQMEDAQKQAATAESTAKAGEATAQTNKLNLETQYGPSGPAAEAKYRFILAKQASGQPLLPEELAFAKGFEASSAKSTTQSDSLGISSVSTNRPSGLAMTGRGGGAVAAPIPAPGGSPGAPMTGTSLPSSVAASPANAKQSIVDEIGQYKMSPALIQRAILKHPELISMIGEKYPDWDQTAYNAKNKIVESYTSGPESKPINAIGTALGHANELRDAIDALGNGDAGLKTLRALGNKMGIEVGSDKTTAFNLIIHRLAPELTAAYVQGGGGEGERAAAAEDFNPAMSRQQLLTNWSNSVKLLRSKISQDEQQWNTTYQPTHPQDAFTTRFLGAPAKQALQRWSNETGNPSGLSGSAQAAPAAPNTHAFSLGAWQKANPQGDPKAAAAAAKQAGYQVTP